MAATRRDIRAFFTSSPAGATTQAETVTIHTQDSTCCDTTDSSNTSSSHPAALAAAAEAVQVTDHSLVETTHHDISSTKDDSPKQPILPSYPKHSSSKSDHNR